MPPESEHAEHPSIKTEERLPVAGEPGIEEAAPEITQEMSHSLLPGPPNPGPSISSHADRGSKERFVAGLQRQKGNAYVQRMIQRKNQGTYDPSSSQGVHLLAHEADNRVQQSSGPVAGTPVEGNVAISRTSDAFEQAAEQTAAHVTSVARQVEPQTQRLVTRELARAPRTISPVITVQRYQAGDTGHGGIEEKAFTAVGFSADEASQIYFGNWLRDLSQVPTWAFPAINVVALGEFGRPVTQEELGTYVPSEHLDNPLAGGTIEDRPDHAPAMTDEKADEGCRDNNLSKSQCAEFKDEEHHRDDILKASKESGLPVYIERGKYHAKKVLEQAIAAKATPEGRSLMGNALHAIEDYFSHSNFTEAAILTLKKEGVGGKKIDTLVDQMKKTDLGEKMVEDFIKSKSSAVPEIVTGTYKVSGNKAVTMMEIFKSEIEHGQLTKAFMLGMLRLGGVGAEELGKRLGKNAGGAVGGVLGGILGGIGGAIGGAERGLFGGSGEANQGDEQGKESGTGFLGKIVSGLVGGAAKGAQAGSTAGEKVGGWFGAGTGQSIGFILDKLAVLGIEGAVMALATIGIVLNLQPFKWITDQILEWRVKVETEKTRTEAPTDPETGKKGPSHSELAKDAPDHPLFAASSYLATEVDKEFGLAMQSAWAAENASPGSPANARPVTDLVDKYVSVPSHDPWWRTKLLESIK
jgi:hypothetical protein